jgi:dynein heavy chain
MERLEDSSMVLSTLSSNRFSSPFRPKLQDWIGKLAAVAEIMEQWLTVQSLWSYMESVFSGGDIARQLPSGTQRFGRADEEFIRLVSTARETGKVMEVCCGSDTLRHALPLLLEQLELCQKGLAAYLGMGRISLTLRFSHAL